MVLRVHQRYRVYRTGSLDGAYDQFAAPRMGSGVFTSTDTTHMDTGLAPGTTCFYRIEACNQDGCSEPSEEVSGSTTAGGSSEVPTFMDAPLDSIGAAHPMNENGP